MKHIFIITVVTILLLTSSIPSFAEALLQPANTQTNDNGIIVTIPKEINYYIETDDDDRFGYDWEINNDFSEIPGIETSVSKGGISIHLPEKNKYYMWLNTLIDDDHAHSFDTEINSTNWNVKITDFSESYISPNLVIAPLSYNRMQEYYFEAIEIMSNPDELPVTVFSTTTDYGECSIELVPSFASAKNNKNVLDTTTDLTLFIDNEQNNIGIWVSSLYEEDIKEYKGSEFSFLCHIRCEGKGGNIYAYTPNETPLVLKENGMFFISYRFLQEGSESFYEADYDGDDEYESLDSSKYFVIENENPTSGIDDHEEIVEEIPDFINGDANPNVVALVNDIPITLEEFQNLLIITRSDIIEEYEQAAEKYSKENLPGLIDQYSSFLGEAGREQIATQTIDELTFMKIIEAEANSMGITNTDDEKQAYIKSMFGYGENDYFDPEYLSDYIAFHYERKVTPEFLSWYFGFGLTMEKLEKIYPDDSDFENWFEGLSQKYNIQYFDNWQNAENYPVFDPTIPSNDSKPSSNRRRW